MGLNKPGAVARGLVTAAAGTASAAFGGRTGASRPKRFFAGLVCEGGSGATAIVVCGFRTVGASADVDGEVAAAVGAEDGEKGGERGDAAFGVGASAGVEAGATSLA